MTDKKLNRGVNWDNFKQNQKQKVPSMNSWNNLCIKGGDGDVYQSIEDNKALN